VVSSGLMLVQSFMKICHLYEMLLQGTDIDIILTQAIVSLSQSEGNRSLKLYIRFHIMPDKLWKTDPVPSTILILLPIET
jgi:hypothetical protein